MNTYKFELLKTMFKSDNINLDDVEKTMKILQQHNYNVWEASDGRWKTYVDDDTKDSGRRLIARKDKSDMFKYLKKYYNEHENITFEELYFDWMEYRKTQVKERTRNRNHDSYKRFYQDSEIVKKNVKEITFLDVELFLCSTIKDNNLNRKQYFNMSLILRDALNYSINKGIIKTSPVNSFVPPKNLLRKDKNADSEDEVFTKDEQDKILEAVKERRRKSNLNYLAIALNFQLGLRVGELSALKWSDIDTDKDYIQIERAENSYREMDEELNLGKNAILVGPPKSAAAYRKLFLTDNALDILAEAKRISIENGWYHEDGYIFSDSKGRIEAYRLNKTMNYICKKLNLRLRNIHNIRKTVITALIDEGLSFEKVRLISGHEDKVTLIKSYYFNRHQDEHDNKLTESALKT